MQNHSPNMNENEWDTAVSPLLNGFVTASYAKGPHFEIYAVFLLFHNPSPSSPIHNFFSQERRYQFPFYFVPKLILHFVSILSIE